MRAAPPFVATFGRGRKNVEMNLDTARMTACATVLVLLVLISLPGCKRKRHDPEALVPEQDLPLLSVVNVNDPAAAPQLVRGFYTLEEGTWRWTMQKFEVTLKPPAGAAEKGARLSLRLTVPEVVSAQLGPMTLHATINGLALAPETYSKSGDYVYTRDVPAAALRQAAVVVEFACDKAIPPSPGDARELAVIAVSAGLEAK